MDTSLVELGFSDIYSFDLMGSCFKFIKPRGRLFVTRATSCPAGYKRVCRQELPAPLQQAALRKVWCYPVQCALPAPRAPLVDHFLDRDQALLRYLGETQVINAAYLQKLVLMTAQAFTRSPSLITQSLIYYALNIRTKERRMRKKMMISDVPN